MSQEEYYATVQPACRLVSRARPIYMYEGLARETTCTRDGGSTGKNGRSSDELCACAISACAKLVATPAVLSS